MSQTVPVVQGTELLLDSSENIVVTANTVQFGNTKVNYSNIEDVIFNSSNAERDGVSAAALVHVRSVSGPSPVSGIDRYKNLELVFTPNALVSAQSFVTHIKELNIPVKETTFPYEVFRSVFFSDKDK